MSGNTTRRVFLQQVAMAGGCLATRAIGAPVCATELQENTAGSTTTPLDTNVIVITQETSRDVNPRAVSWIYITEILQRAGLFFKQLPLSGLPTLTGNANLVILLSGNLKLSEADCKTVADLVGSGASIVGIGGTSGLDNVFGVSDPRPLAEGWIKVTDPEHAVTAGLRSSLHVFGGYAVRADSAKPLAQVESGRQGAKGSAIVEHRFGQGHAILLAPDLVFSVVHIQQGVPVLQDGVASPDGSALLNDGELKAEDGLVLDWERDRTPMKPDGVPTFLEPITDELRELILRSVFYVARQQGVTLPMIWYWPRGLKAIGHISHDTDGHDPQKAVSLLKVMNRCQVKSTWCTLYPGGYPKEFYETLKKQGYEVALHYDARTGGADTSWSKKNFLMQHHWLLEEAGLDRIISNKNHYTRWENRLDFLRWCEEVGIKSDQTRGPSKQGAIGFPLGGSQPYFALDDEGVSPRFIHVLQVNMLTQDLVVVCPREYGEQLVDSVLRHHGVAHFLFHPAHIEKDNVADALCGLVEYGRKKGLEWWTSEQIYSWEVDRREVRATIGPDNSLVLRAPKPVREATLLFLKPNANARSFTTNGKPTTTDNWNVYGFEFDAMTVDVNEATKVTLT